MVEETSKREFFEAFANVLTAEMNREFLAQELLLFQHFVNQLGFSNTEDYLKGLFFTKDGQVAEDTLEPSCAKVRSEFFFMTLQPENTSTYKELIVKIDLIANKFIANLTIKAGESKEYFTKARAQEKTMLAMAYSRPQSVEDLKKHFKQIHIIEKAQVELAKAGKVITSLEWKGKDAFLTSLSLEFHTKEFTESSYAFWNLFKEQKKLYWLKEPHFLAYLLYKLYKAGQFKKGAGGKGYYIDAQELCCDYSKKSEHKIDFKTLVHNITKRHASGYDQLKEDVDQLLSPILK